MRVFSTGGDVVGRRSATLREAPPEGCRSGERPLAVVGRSDILTPFVRTYRLRTEYQSTRVMKGFSQVSA